MSFNFNGACPLRNDKKNYSKVDFNRGVRILKSSCTFWIWLGIGQILWSLSKSFSNAKLIWTQLEYSIKNWEEVSHKDKDKMPVDTSNFSYPSQRNIPQSLFYRKRARYAKISSIFWSGILTGRMFKMRDLQDEASLYCNEEPEFTGRFLYARIRYCGW